MVCPTRDWASAICADIRVGMRASQRTGMICKPKRTMRSSYVASETRIGAAVRSTHPARPQRREISYGPSLLPAERLISSSTPLNSKPNGKALRSIPALFVLQQFLPVNYQGKRRRLCFPEAVDQKALAIWTYVIRECGGCESFPEKR